MEESKIRDLIDKLNYYTKLYDEGKPEISDQEWDDMYFKLVTLEKKTGTYFEDSPTQRVNYQVVNKLNKVEHSHPMLSLDKTKDTNAVKSFIGNKRYVAMAKMDGLTCSLTYRGGRLVKAETRGNGEIGEDILHNALVVKNIPNKIEFYDELVIDGEIICDYKSFEKFENEYKNPRNFASGSIRLLDSAECDKRNLSFVVWDVIKGFEAVTLTEKLLAADYLDFTIVPMAPSVGNIESDIEQIQLKCKALGYPIDGVVFKYDNIDEYDAAGRTDHHFKGGLAYKFYDEEYETKLKNIDFSMSRNGTLTPVAIFEPIDIDGTEVSRANLFNMTVMKQLLGNPWEGQKVWVYKANMIIPQISRAEEDNSRTKAYIKVNHIQCPICGGDTYIEQLNDSEVLKCGNPQCEGKLVNRIDHFLGKKGLDVKGISKATIEKLIDWGWVNSISDIFNLSKWENEWVKKDGFGIKSVGNILESLGRSSTCNLESVIAGAGIPLIGRTVARDIARRFTTYDSFREAIKGDYDFSEINGFGYEMNKSLKNFDYNELDYIVDNFLTIEQKIEDKKKQKLEGLTFCVTGKIKNWKNRDELSSYIAEMGGKVVGSMSANVDYLINNDVTSTSAKNNRAKELDKPIIDEQTFMDMFDL